MTYPSYITLKLVATLLGLIYLGGHLPGALFPGWFREIARKFPRNYPTGVVLMSVATIWFVYLTSFVDLSELSSWRQGLMTLWAIGGFLMIMFVPVFLAVRSVGCLLLLASLVMMDSTFLVDTPARHVVTILAYIWVIFGMILVGYPYLLRDIIEFTTKTPDRCRAFCWPGVLFGVVLLILASTVYP